MNEDDIDYLFLAMENEEYDEVLRYAGIEVNINQDAGLIFVQNKAEILSKIMKKIEAGDYDYFYSKKDTSSYEELRIFSDLMSHSSKIDDIKNVIENAKEMKISLDCVVRLIAGTHEPKYIKEVINNDNGKREKLGIELDFFKIIELISATGETEYIKKCIEGEEKIEELEKNRNSFLFPAEMIELIKKINDVNYIKQFIEDKDKRKKILGWTNAFECIELIKATKDVAYIKDFIENKEKREKLGIGPYDVAMLIQATQDTEYIKSFLEDEGKRRELGVMFDGKCYAKLLEGTQDAGYIKNFLEDNNDGCKYKLLNDNKYNINLIKATKDVEYIKSIIDDKEKREKLGINLTSSRAVELIKETCDIDYIKKCIEDREKVKELQIQCYVLNLIEATKDAEYIKSLMRDEKKRRKLDLDLDHIIECIKVLKVEEINDIVNEVIKNNTDFSTESKRKIKLPENMTAGIEIESEGPYSYSILKLTNKLEKGWKCKHDLSLFDDGVEIISPILTGDNEKNSNSIKNICRSLNALGQSTSENCGGHIHIGSEYLTSPEAWMNLIEIWGNCEEIFYTISNKEGEIPREGIRQFAQPISGNFEKMINSETVQLNTIEDLRSFTKKSQEISLSENYRYFGINFQNLGKAKNTIEFRLPNGTVDADNWIENINLFGGLVRTSEELAKIQKKSDEDRTEEDKRKFECLEKIKNEEISQEEKLEFLLELIITEEDRDIYRRRYQVNNKLIAQDSAIQEIIKQKTAKESIDVKKIAKKIFAGEKTVTGQDYDKNNKILQNNLQKENFDLEVE